MNGELGEDPGLRSSGPLLDLRAAARAIRLSVEAAPELVESARLTWRGRMVNEHGSSRVFAALALQLGRAGFDASVVAECAGFAEEERRHGVLCGAVVEALGGEARAPARVEHDLPEHDDVSRAEAALRNVLSVSCLSETVAVALIGAERLEMPEGALRDLLTEIWSDEIGHSRFGWRLLASVAPSLDDAAKERLGAYLAVAFAHVEEHELAHLPDRLAPPRGESLGLCSGREARRLFYETIEEAIVPALEAHGLPARAAWSSRGSLGFGLRVSSADDAARA